jgi:uncharacterized protein YecE (DUF72 family)
MISDRYSYLYSDEELEQFVNLIERVKQYVNLVFVILHNDTEANSLINGFKLRHLVEKKKRLNVPQKLVKAYPVLKPISAEVSEEYPLFAEIN